MTNTPGNGSARFQDLYDLVVRVDTKVDSHSERLAGIEARLDERPCALHGAQIREIVARQELRDKTVSDMQAAQAKISRSVERTTGKIDISVAKIGGIAAVVAAAAAAVVKLFGYWLQRGWP